MYLGFKAPPHKRGAVILLLQPLLRPKKSEVQGLTRTSNFSPLLIAKDIIFALGVDKLGPGGKLGTQMAAIVLGVKLGNQSSSPKALLHKYPEFLYKTGTETLRRKPCFPARDVPLTNGLF